MYKNKFKQLFKKEKIISAYLTKVVSKLLMIIAPMDISTTVNHDHLQLYMVNFNPID